MAGVLRRQKKRFVKFQGNVDTAAEAGNQEELARILAAMEQAQGGAPARPPIATTRCGVSTEAPAASRPSPPAWEGPACSGRGPSAWAARRAWERRD